MLNLPTVTMSVAEYLELVRAGTPPESIPDENLTPRASEIKTKRRKVSKYSKQFGKEMKKLIAKHPRTDVTRLMKRAHTNTRKALK